MQTDPGAVMDPELAVLKGVRTSTAGLSPSEPVFEKVTSGVYTDSSSILTTHHHHSVIKTSSNCMFLIIYNYLLIFQIFTTVVLIFVNVFIFIFSSLYLFRYSFLCYI